MFKVNWEEFAQREFAIQITSQLNSIILKRFEEDKTLRDNLSHLSIRSLSFGTTPPIFRILNITEAPKEDEFEEHRKRALEIREKQRQSDKELDSNEYNPLGISPMFRHLLSHQSQITTTGLLKAGDEDDYSDHYSVTSEGSHILTAKLMQQFADEAPSPTKSTTSSTRRRAAHQPRYAPPVISPVASQPQLSSLEKFLLPTHIASIGTLYKKKKKVQKLKNKESEETWIVVQTKRRSDWWKKRITETKGTNISNVLDTAASIPDELIQPVKKVSKKDKKIKEEKKGSDVDLAFILGEGPMITLQITYDGNASLQIETEVLVNIPVPRFITLPIDVTLSHLSIDAKLTVIYRPGKDHEVVAYLEDEGPNQAILLKDLILGVEMGAPLIYEPKSEEDMIYSDREKIETIIKDAVQFFAREHIVYPNVIRHHLDLNK
jgi:hypothetical protein